MHLYPSLPLPRLYSHSLLLPHSRCVHTAPICACELAQSITGRPELCEHFGVRVVPAASSPPVLISPPPFYPFPATGPPPRLPPAAPSSPPRAPPTPIASPPPLRMLPPPLPGVPPSGTEAVLQIPFEVQTLSGIPTAALHCTRQPLAQDSCATVMAKSLVMTIIENEERLEAFVSCTRVHTGAPLDVPPSPSCQIFG